MPPSVLLPYHAEVGLSVSRNPWVLSVQEQSVEVFGHVRSFFSHFHGELDNMNIEVLAMEESFLPETQKKLLSAVIPSSNC